MSDTTDAEELAVQHHPHVRSARRFLLMIGGVIVVSIVLVGVSMALYNSSGAAQLDLSRPGYQSVRSQATHIDQTTTFPSQGDLNSTVYQQYLQQYQAQQKQLTSDAFGGDVMSDQTLQLDATPVTSPASPTPTTQP